MSFKNKDALFATQKRTQKMEDPMIFIFRKKGKKDLHYEICSSVKEAMCLIARVNR